MSFCRPQSGAFGDGEELIGTEAGRSSSDGGRRIRSPRTFDFEAFAVEVLRHDDVVIVQPRGELDLASVGTLRAALDGLESAGSLVLDLRGLSFMDSTALHLLMALHQRSQRDGFQLTLHAPAAPIDRAIQLCGLSEVLPFVAEVDAEPGGPASGPPHGR